MMYQMNTKPVYRVTPRAYSLLGDPFFRSMMGMEPPRRPMGMRVDVRETEDAYILEAELPGVKLEDITLTTENDVLTIAADRGHVRREERAGYVMQERMSGRVERRFALEGIAQEGITAHSVDGILTVTLPKEKPEGTKSLRRIAIGTAASAALPAEAETSVPDAEA